MMPNSMLVRRIAPFAAGVLTGGTIKVYYDRQKEERDDLDRKENLYKYGKPEPSVTILEYKSHTLAYDNRNKTPVWVMEHLSNKQEITADRKKSNFQPDPNLPVEFTATNSDYFKSGWSRGHMAASGNYKHCQGSMDDTFYLTNIVPQNFNNNENYWYRMEDYCRKLAKKYDEVRVISGPLFLPESKDEGKRYVSYQVIGKNCVQVPTHLFKVIVVERKNGEPPLLGSFVVPNQPITEEPPLVSFSKPLEDIEQFCGTKLLRFLQKHKCSDLCDVDGCQLMSKDKYDLIYYQRRISNARDEVYLKNIWSTMIESGIKPTVDMEETYKTKLNELKKTPAK